MSSLTFAVVSWDINLKHLRESQVKEVTTACERPFSRLLVGGVITVMEIFYVKHQGLAGLSRRLGLTRRLGPRSSLTQVLKINVP